MATIHEFGTAPEQAKDGYYVVDVVIGEDGIASQYGEEVRLVRGAAVSGCGKKCEFAVMKNTRRNAANQLQRAWFLGMQAHKEGIKSAPCLDAELMSMFKGRKGLAPEGEASSLDLMSEWSKAWHNSNLE